MKPFHVDLTPFLNNAGTCTAADRTGGFTPVGSCYPAEHLPAYGSAVVFEDKSFVFPVKTAEGYDNMELEAQEIGVPRAAYHQIDLLGACFNGSYFETFELLLDGQVVHRFQVKLSNFGNNEGWFGEPTVIRCPLIRAKNMDLTNVTASIYGHFETLAEPILFDTIRAGDNPFMHIFAITLRGDF
ncbi:hypothetical protein OS242_09740 [Tumebacillus sp. DT12]|uniref:Uncharacterized protein n=1 Tax=Tumebacillus lacus TaxID=2995335 RepID=A0ABT3X008_9BACL|nr:hypothetical protein [Tumebacillus lacus]MCX7570243.1 hypothetical protein [Tumebacillus lacus]